MSRCGCTDRCSCSVVQGPGVTVTGAGSPTNPFVISASGSVPTLGTLQYILAVGGVYAVRPATTDVVVWIGPSIPAAGGTTAGGAGYVAGLDVWMRTL
jgi:hypothetical protein